MVHYYYSLIILFLPTSLFRHTNLVYKGRVLIIAFGCHRKEKELKIYFIMLWIQATIYCTKTMLIVTGNVPLFFEYVLWVEVLTTRVLYIFHYFEFDLILQLTSLYLRVVLDWMCMYVCMYVCKLYVLISVCSLFPLWVPVF